MNGISPSLILYQPDIPQNAGTTLRLAACFGLGVEVIEPCGFLWDDTRMRRAGMDYMDRLQVIRHRSYQDFRAAHASNPNRRIVLLTTKGAEPLPGFRFQPGDAIMVGRESAGVPDQVALDADARVRIPLVAGMRSFNVAASAAMAAFEALRQLNGFPEGDVIP